MAFIQKSVNPTGRIGRDLIELRERAGWTRVAVADQTKIAESLICAWEHERWEEVGDAIYGERILRAYVEFLGGSAPYFLGKYRESLDATRFERLKEDMLPRVRKIRLIDFLAGYKTFTIIGFLCFAFGLAGYVYYQVSNISSPPVLEIEAPLDGASLDGPTVYVQGHTLPESTVTVNARQALVEPDGRFSFALDVPRGTTVLFIAAKKRHGKETVVTRRVIYDRPLPDVRELFIDESSEVTSTKKVVQ